jgi:hypothetical protein
MCLCMQVWCRLQVRNYKSAFKFMNRFQVADFPLHKIYVRKQSYQANLKPANLKPVQFPELACLLACTAQQFLYD